MTLVGEVKDGISAIREILTGYSNWKVKNTNEKRAAIEAVLTAANRTRQYERDVRGGSKSVEVERDLAKLWLKAGIQLSSVDAELAGRCIIKSDRWSDPEIWDWKKHPGISINLDQIIADSQSLLLNLPKDS